MLETLSSTTMAASIRASNKGLEIVDRARRKKGWSKSEEAWAGLATTTVPTLKRFWAGITIKSETFQEICKAVGIYDWESIADFEVRDKSLEKTASKRLAFAIAGSLEEIDKNKLDAIVALLHKLGGDTTIEILNIDEGSIKLILGGSQEALEKIEALFKSEALNQISGISVQDVHFLEKQELISLIHKNGGTSLNLILADLSGANLFRADLSGANLLRANLLRANLILADLSEANLSEANLSRADLSRADLSEANLSGADLILADLILANLSGANLILADLSGADLSRADLSRARFGSNSGLTEAAILEMKKRGAIFDNPPESDVPSFVNR